MFNCSSRLKKKNTGYRVDLEDIAHSISSLENNINDTILSLERNVNTIFIAFQVLVNIKNYLTKTLKLVSIVFHYDYLKKHTSVEREYGIIFHNLVKCDMKVVEKNSQI